MKKRIVLFLTLFISSMASADIISESYCFTTGEEKLIELEMRTYFDTATKWSTGFIRYKNSRKPIPIVLKNTEAEVISKDRPYQTTQTWLEISENKVSGEYEMVSQGTSISSFIYTNFKRKKKYAFLLDSNIDSSNGCQSTPLDTDVPGKDLF